MAYQTAYPATFTAAFEGMLADSFESDMVSKANLDAAALSFGRGVRDGAGAAGMTAFSAASQVLLGVLVFGQRDSSRLAGTGAIAQTETGNVLRKGRVWVRAEQAVALNSPVFVRHTANGGTTAPGRFRIDIDTANATAVTSARFVTTSSTADQLVILELNLP